jgi:hypothetical protein
MEPPAEPPLHDKSSCPTFFIGGIFIIQSLPGVLYRFLFLTDEVDYFLFLAGWFAPP